MICKLAGKDIASVETVRGGRHHVYLDVVVLIDASYQTLTGGTFIPPTNLVPAPIIEGGLKVVEIAMQQNSFKEHIRECKHHKEGSNATKKIITGAFEEKNLIT